MKKIISKAILPIFAVTLLLISLTSCKEKEEKNPPSGAVNEFYATVAYYAGDSVTVTPLPEEDEAKSSDLITFSLKNVVNIDAQKGETVLVKYTGGIEESYPAQINAVAWEKKIIDDRTKEYAGEWLSKETAEKLDYQPFIDIKITEIYKNCFFAKSVVPMPYIIKMNGELSEDWCIGDQVAVTSENVYYDHEANRMEAELLTIEESDFKLEEGKAYKPVIYLYPETQTEVSLSLDLKGKLICTYPKYENGWRVTAEPDGTLFDGKQEYNYLYWEGSLDTEYDFSEGFCVKGEETAEFLDYALEKLGLTRREANEFIVFWLPQMEENEYNIISFQGEKYTESAALSVSPKADTTLRVFMAYYPSNEYVEIPKQTLDTTERNGFTVVEWGGAEVSER